MVSPTLACLDSSAHPPHMGGWDPRGVGITCLTLSDRSGRLSVHLTLSRTPQPRGITARVANNLI